MTFWGLIASSRQILDAIGALPDRTDTNADKQWASFRASRADVVWGLLMGRLESGDAGHFAAHIRTVVGFGFGFHFRSAPTGLRREVDSIIIMTIVLADDLACVIPPLTSAGVRDVHLCALDQISPILSDLAPTFAPRATTSYAGQK